MKTALVTGVTGQDGSYLTEFLLAKGYEVHGLIRPQSTDSTFRLGEVMDSGDDFSSRLHLHYGDLCDASGLMSIVGEVRPDEVYNLAAQSHVAISFENPEYTADVNALGTLRLLEAIRCLKLEDVCRFYQASTSELYGLVRETPQTENTDFYPRSPYAVAKLYAYWITVNYRESYGMYACNGILFNHESPRRGQNFVTRKITMGLSEVVLGMRKHLSIGNLDACRDWGHAKDYVEMQWLMLQQENACDYVIATGKQHSVREFIYWTARELGIELEFRGRGLDETAIVMSCDNSHGSSLSEGDVIVKVDPRYYRPAEVETLLGDAHKARRDLGWTPSISAQDLCKEMVSRDYEDALRRRNLGSAK